MAIIQYASNRYGGLSSDIKPSPDSPGYFFIEQDTGAVFVWNGAAWLAIPLDHTNLLPPDIHVPYNFVFANAAARTGASYVAGDIGKFIRQTDTEDIWMLTSTAPTFVKVSGSGTGEPNTASNVGTAGVGVFKQKTGVDLEFKKINAGSAKITITDDTLNDEVDIDLDQDEIDGDILEIAYTPANYTPATPDPEHLASHLEGIDDALSTVASTLPDTGCKRPVRLATVSALPAYAPSGSGVGKILQANANGALSVDGIGVVYGDRILVKNETGVSRVHNGIYTVTNPGDVSNKYVLTRATDYDQDNEVVAGHLVPCSEGNTNADETFILITDGPIVIDSSLLEYNALKLGITSQTVISASANTVVDSITLSQYHSAEWIVDIYDSVAGNREASKVIAREENLSALFSQYATVGDTIAYVITFTSDGTSMSFKIQNNESNDITVRVRKFEV